ncbi:hypothetical protein NJB14192_24230 [Mycobacterium montefiorense]|nr:hypothetical protein NJB14192_24230 [Mycobacterium montefiorense]
MFTSHLAHPVLQFGGPIHGHSCPALVGHRRVGPIGWQRCAFGHPGQGILPKVQLGGYRALGIVEIAEMGVLPQGVIGILHGQFGPPGGLSCASGGVRLAQIAHQWCDRPAVGGNVVHDSHQHVRVFVNAQERGPQWEFGGQIEWVAHRGVDCPVKSGCGPVAGIDYLPTEFGPIGRHHHLLGYAVGSHEHCSQTLMPCHHVDQRGSQ